MVLDPGVVQIFLKSFRIFFMAKKLIIALILYMIFFQVQAVRASNIGGQSALLAASSSDGATSVLSDKELKYQIKRKVIKKILTANKSPMAESTDAFVAACIKYDLDCYLLPSIAGLESSFGTKTYPGSNNAFGWGRGLIMFESWDHGIMTVGEGLKTKYIDKGLVSVEEIGRKYCEGDTWAPKVRSISRKFEQEEAKMRLFFSLNKVEL